MEIMSDITILQDMYRELHAASVAKDADRIRSLLAEDYCLIHMTGMRQPGEEYISSVTDGTLKWNNLGHVLAGGNGAVGDIEGKSELRQAYDFGKSIQ